MSIYPFSSKTTKVSSPIFAESTMNGPERKYILFFEKHQQTNSHGIFHHRMDFSVTKSIVI